MHVCDQKQSWMVPLLIVESGTETTVERHSRNCQTDRRLSVRALTNNLLQTVRRYSTSQCGQYRYEFTYELTRITKVSTQWFIGINILLLLFCGYFMNIFLFQTSSLCSFNVCFSLGECSMTSPFRFSYLYLDINSPSEGSLTLPMRVLVQCDRQILLSVFFKCWAYSNPISSPIYHLSLPFVWNH